MSHTHKVVTAQRDKLHTLDTPTFTVRSQGGWTLIHTTTTQSDLIDSDCTEVLAKPGQKRAELGGKKPSPVRSAGGTAGLVVIDR